LFRWIASDLVYNYVSLAQDNYSSEKTVKRCSVSNVLNLVLVTRTHVRLRVGWSANTEAWTSVSMTLRFDIVGGDPELVLLQRKVSPPANTEASSI